MEEGIFVCYSCGRKVGYALGKPPCEALAGWFILTCWKGQESVDHLAFCSFTCLRRWVDTKVPKIPQTFFRSFAEDSINHE